MLTRRSQWRKSMAWVCGRSLAGTVGSNPCGVMDISCECCVLSGRGDELNTRPEESYRLWCVVVCEIETARMREAMTRAGPQGHKKRKYRLTHVCLCYKKVVKSSGKLVYYIDACRRSREYRKLSFTLVKVRLFVCVIKHRPLKVCRRLQV